MTESSASLVHAITVQRDGDRHSLMWCFDVDEQFHLAVKHADAAGARILTNEVRALPEREMVSDAEEFRLWVTFEYLQDGDEA